MAEKISTLVLDVELDCPRCYKKMKKALCRCKADCKCHEIRSQVFDEKQKKVIISGPFDPEKLIKKLYRKVGCKIIKGYTIQKKEDEKPKPKPDPPKPPLPEPKPDPPKPPPPEPKPDPPKPPPPTRTPPFEPDPPPRPQTPPPALAPPEPKPEPPKPPPPEPKPDPPKPVPTVGGPVYVYVGPFGPSCWCRPGYPCRPCYEGNPRSETPILALPAPKSPKHDPPEPEPVFVNVGPGHRVCCRDFNEGNPRDGICTRSGGSYESGCRFFSDEDPACIIM